MLRSCIRRGNTRVLKRVFQSVVAYGDLVDLLLVSHRNEAVYPLRRLLKFVRVFNVMKAFALSMWVHVKKVFTVAQGLDVSRGVTTRQLFLPILCSSSTFYLCVERV